jgi:hypothetical protein
MFERYPYEKSSFIGTDWFTDELGLFGAEQAELPNKLTPMSPDEVAKALAAGFKKLTGKAPSTKILDLLMAQWALETGNGKSTHNYNFTNIKRNAGDPYFQYFRCSEIIDGVEVFFDPPHPQCAFAAYKTPADGAAAYIRILKKRPHWWAGLMSEDINVFNNALSTTPKFYTASPSLYLSALKDRATKYLPQAKRYGASILGTVMQVFFGLAIGSTAVYYGPAAIQRVRQLRSVKL